MIVVLSACSVQKHYSVPTTALPVTGNCNTSRVDEIGAALPLTGPQAQLGTAYLDGVKLAVTHSNHSQGILMRHVCLELVYKDVGDNVHVGDRAVLDLVNGEVVTFLVAPFQSATIQFTGSDLGQAGIPNTTFSSLNQTRDRNNYPMTFPTAPSASVQASKLASYAKGQHWSKVAVVALDDPAGQEIQSEFKSDFAHDGGSVVGSTPIDPNKPFTSAQLDALRADNPQALVVVGDTAQVGQPLIARQSAGWTVPVVVTADGADQSVVTHLSSAGMSGVSVLVPQNVVLSPHEQEPTNWGGFVTNLKSFLHVSTLRGSVIPYAQAYDGTMMLLFAANSINSVAPTNIQTYLENANYQGLLASYNFTSVEHTGVSAKDLTVANLDTLSNGFFHHTSTSNSTPNSGL
jgi:branched-chain amino acid transport system substrate-binding protein